MTTLRRLLIVLLTALILTASAYGAGLAQEHWFGSDGSRDASAGPVSAAGPGPQPTRPARTADEPRRKPGRQEVVAAPTPLEPAMVPGPALMRTGRDGEDVRDLQARLAQIGWFDAGVSGFYGDVTTASVRGFQAKREIPVTGEVDRRTMDRLLAMTTAPTTDELHPERVLAAAAPSAALDPRCTTGRVLCIDKTTSTLSLVVDGQVRSTLAARFGAATTPTREGVFSVLRMDRDHVSNLYGSAMPFSMFFSGGQAVHYSSDFAAAGYAGASHGCVNIRDYDALAAIYDQVALGDRVVVHRS